MIASKPSHPPGRGGQRGVSAFELVLVLAATLIVASLGVSWYRTHSVRSQISAALDEAGAARALVAAAFAERGAPPHDAQATGIDESAVALLVGTYLDSVQVDNGRIDLQFGDNADAAIAGKTLSLTPFETVDREIVWICGNELPDVGLHPLGFAGGGAQAAQRTTSIEDRFLPPGCR